MTRPSLTASARVRRAGLLGLRPGGSRRPTLGSTVEARAFEIRQDGDGLAGRFAYDVDTITIRPRRGPPAGGSPQESHKARRVQATRSKTKRGRFSYLWALTIDRPLASKLAGSLDLEDGPEALAFRVERLPDTSYVRDFRAQLAAGAAQFGVRPLYRIPPAETVADAVSIVPEAGNPGVNIEVVNEAVLTGLAVVSRAAAW